MLSRLFGLYSTRILHIGSQYLTCSKCSARGTVRSVALSAALSFSLHLWDAVLTVFKWPDRLSSISRVSVYPRRKCLSSLSSLVPTVTSLDGRYSTHRGKDPKGIHIIPTDFLSTLSSGIDHESDGDAVEGNISTTLYGDYRITLSRSSKRCHSEWNSLQWLPDFHKAWT